jgi:hypothetical protein
VAALLPPLGGARAPTAPGCARGGLALPGGLGTSAMVCLFGVLRRARGRALGSWALGPHAGRTEAGALYWAGADRDSGSRPGVFPLHIWTAASASHSTRRRTSPPRCSRAVAIKLGMLRARCASASGLPVPHAAAGTARERPAVASAVLGVVFRARPTRPSSGCIALPQRLEIIRLPSQLIGLGFGLIAMHHGAPVSGASFAFAARAAAQLWKSRPVQGTAVPRRGLGPARQPGRGS